MKKGVVDGVALSKGSQVGQKPKYAPMMSKNAKPYSNQSRAKAAGMKKKGF